MPDFYAHYIHGQRVFALLSPEIAAGISNKNLYNQGLQGPDFLYFYKPFKKNNNPVLQLAKDIHNKNFSNSISISAWSLFISSTIAFT